MHLQWLFPELTELSLVPRKLDVRLGIPKISLYLLRILHRMRRVDHVPQTFPLILEWSRCILGRLAVIYHDRPRFIQIERVSEQLLLSLLLFERLLLLKFIVLGFSVMAELLCHNWVQRPSIFVVS